jgi:hypothetical protein
LPFRLRFEIEKLGRQVSVTGLTSERGQSIIIVRNFSDNHEFLLIMLLTDARKSSTIAPRLKEAAPKWTQRSVLSPSWAEKCFSNAVAPTIPKGGHA